MFGEGPPLVPTHGTPSRSLVWRQIAPALADSHTVYVLDLLGFGASERHVDQDVSLIAHAEVLADLIERWGIDRPALIGHNIGGAVVSRAHLLELVPSSWEGEEGQAVYLRNLVQLDEDHTRAFEPLLGRMTVPTAIVWGACDAWLPAETAERIAARIPSATVTILPNAGHFCMEDDPVGVTNAIAQTSRALVARRTPSVLHPILAAATGRCSD
jgi:pimeloyl-ACP methyl ester carboxylesterase